MATAKMKTTLVRGVFGTSALTLYSSLASAAHGDRLCVPEVLAMFVKHSKNLKTNGWHRPLGWLAHYAIGMAWAAVYGEAYSRKICSPDRKGTVLLGVLSGLAAVVTWKQLYRLHPQPPQTPLGVFLPHLAAGHVAYSMAVTVLAKQDH